MAPLLLALVVSSIVAADAVFEGIVYKIRHGNPDGYLDAFQCFDRDDGQEYVYVTTGKDFYGQFWKFINDGEGGFFIQNVASKCWLDGWDCKDRDRGQRTFLTRNHPYPGQHWKVGEGHDSLIWVHGNCRLDDSYSGPVAAHRSAFLDVRNDGYWGQVWSFELQASRYTLETAIIDFDFVQPDFSKLKGQKTGIDSATIMNCAHNTTTTRHLTWSETHEESNTLEFDVGMSLGFGEETSVEADVPLLGKASAKESFSWSINAGLKTSWTSSKSSTISLETDVTVQADHAICSRGFFTMYEKGSYSVDFTATGEVKAKENGGEYVMDGDAIHAIFALKGGKVDSWSRGNGVITVKLHGTMSATVGMDSFLENTDLACMSGFSDDRCHLELVLV